MKKEQGFTLIELLVTISLIAVLSAIAIVYYGNTNQKARDNKRRSDLEQVRAALEMYRSQQGTYPTTSSWNTMIGDLQAGGYINQEPEDPRSGSYSYYYTSSDGTTYEMYAYLEGCDTCSDYTGIGCGNATCNYQVTSP